MVRQGCYRIIPETDIMYDSDVAAFRDMKMDILAEGSDYGTREIRETIKGKPMHTRSTYG
jgi:hypothetical protein